MDFKSGWCSETGEFLRLQALQRAGWLDEGIRNYEIRKENSMKIKTNLKAGDGWVFTTVPTIPSTPNPGPQPDSVTWGT